MKNVCVDNLICTLTEAHNSLALDHVGYIGLACLAFVVVSVIRFVFMD